MKRRYAQDFRHDLDTLLKTGRANGYIFVVHAGREIITVSRNRRHITTFGFSRRGVEDARFWLKAVCEVQA